MICAIFFFGEIFKTVWAHCHRIIYSGHPRVSPLFLTCWIRSRFKTLAFSSSCASILTSSGLRHPGYRLSNSSQIWVRIVCLWPLCCAVRREIHKRSSSSALACSRWAAYFNHSLCCCPQSRSTGVSAMVMVMTRPCMSLGLNRFSSVVDLWSCSSTLDLPNLLFRLFQLVSSVDPCCVVRVHSCVLQVVSASESLKNSLSSCR